MEGFYQSLPDTHRLTQTHKHTSRWWIRLNIDNSAHSHWAHSILTALASVSLYIGRKCKCKMVQTHVAIPSIFWLLWGHGCSVCRLSEVAPTFFPLVTTLKVFGWDPVACPDQVGCAIPLVRSESWFPPSWTFPEYTYRQASRWRPDDMPEPFLLSIPGSWACSGNLLVIKWAALILLITI